MLSHDKIIKGPTGLVLASFGPRRLSEDGQHVVECSPEQAFSFGVFGHDCTGRAKHIVDVTDEASAAAAAQLVAKGDPETIAFIAAGFTRYLSTRGSVPVADGWELNLVTEAIAYAGMLDVLAAGRDLDGEFGLEVAEPFGAWAARVLSEDKRIAPRDAEDRIRELIAEAMPAESDDAEHPYLVSWRIDVDASSPEEAARKALAVQRDPESIALVFDVAEKHERTVTVDLCREHGPSGGMDVRSQDVSGNAQNVPL